MSVPAIAVLMAAERLIEIGREVGEPAPDTVEPVLYRWAESMLEAVLECPAAADALVAECDRRMRDRARFQR